MSEARQIWEAARYATNARFVADLGASVVELLAPTAGERILDLGCGDGALTETLVGLGCRVVGVDAGPDMVEAARARGLDARLGDGQALPDLGESDFDAVFSNAALHWMPDPDAVIRGVRRVLRPGGRFVGEFGGHGNVAAILVALLAALEAQGVDGRPEIPWYFPTTDAYRERLEHHGFVVQSIELIPRPTPLPTDMSGWLSTFAEGFFRALPEAKRGPARHHVIALLEPCLRDDRGRWTADYVRLRFKAVLPD